MALTAVDRLVRRRPAWFADHIAVKTGGYSTYNAELAVGTAVRARERRRRLDEAD